MGLPPHLAGRALLLLGLLARASAAELCDEGVENDDYCDCFDGADEPATSACAGRGPWEQAAGSPTLFECAAGVGASRRVPLSRVGDGVCDCCDGSDERGSRFAAACANTCAAESDALLAVAESAAGTARLGHAIRAKTALATKRQTAELGESGSDLRQQASELRVLRNRLRFLKADEEVAERGERNRRRRACLLMESGAEDVQTTAVFGECLTPGAVRLTVPSVQDKSLDGAARIVAISGTQAKDGKIRVSPQTLTVEQYLQKQEKRRLDPEEEFHRVTKLERQRRTLLDAYINHGRTGGLLFAAHCCQLVGLAASPVSLGAKYVWAKVGTPATETFAAALESAGLTNATAAFAEDGFAAVSPALDYRRYGAARFVYGAWRSAWGYVTWPVGLMWDAPGHVYRSFFYDVSEDPWQRLEAVLMRQASVLVEEEYATVQRKLKKVKSDETIAYGDDAVWYALHGKCFDIKTHDVKYRYCPFDVVKQDGQPIGRWGRWSGAAPPGSEMRGRGRDRDDPNLVLPHVFTAQHYDKGKHCQGIGGTRECSVEMQCGDKDRIVSATEPDICRYHIIFETPLACTDQVLEAAESAVRRLQ